MIKVLIWGATDTVGGVETVLWNYVSHIPTNQIQFDFINTYEDISIGDKVRKRGSRVYALPNRKKHFLAYRKALKNFMAAHAKEYSVVWLNDCMFGNIDILKLAKKHGICRRIIHAHNSLNMGGGVSRLIRHKLNSWLLRFYVTDYWACSELAGNWSYSKDVVKSGRIKVVPNAVEVEKFTVQEEIRHKIRVFLEVDDKIVFGHVGRFHFQKNHLFLIDVFNEIQKLMDNAIMILIGSGEEEPVVKQRVSEYGLEQSVKFLGTRKDTNELYQAMDAFLLPSLFEGLPVVMVEAQASGLPCFVADNITKESDISGNVRFYSLSMEPKQWAESIVEEMEHFTRKDVRETITGNGYNIDRTAKDMLSDLKGEKK
ncbi:MAG: glycosyltransferase family 1 protein [Lachnospiraceae bacterium]|nr:glycosyltransferase family 1 protein [Lachnospiraceae bacterium]